MYISARTDYAVRAMLVVADSHPRLTTAAQVAAAQRIPAGFLSAILLDLRKSGLLSSCRGVDGGYRLGRPAGAISVGDILRVVGGDLTTVRGGSTTGASYRGTARGLRQVWLSVDAAIAGVVDRITLSDLLVSERGLSF